MASFFDKFKKVYIVQARCFNCGQSQACKIPKGNTIDSWLKTPESLCDNCGNPTLQRIEMVQAPAQAQKPAKVLVRPVQQQRPVPIQFPLQPQPRPVQQQQRPRPQQQSQQPLQRRQRVDYPVTKPVAPEPGDVYTYDETQPNPSFKKVNFWTGDELK